MADSGKVTLEETLRAMPLNDGQGCWHDVFSPTRVLTAEEKLNHNMNQQQQQQQVNKHSPFRRASDRSHLSRYSLFIFYPSSSTE